MADDKKSHPGERLASYFNSFFTTIVGVSTFGASVTFSKVLSTPVTPWIDYGISTDAIQNYLAISWLLFLLDLAITSFATSALSLYRPQAVKYFGTNDSSDRRIVMWYATVVSFALFGLLMAAFTFLGLAATAYVGPIGWVAVGFTAFFAVLGIGVIIWQSPIGSKRIGDTGSPAGSNGYISDEKADSWNGGRLNGDDYIYGERAPEKRVYTDPAIPSYTADLRRLRSARNSDGSRYVAGAGPQLRGDWSNVSDMRTYNNTPI